jgi:UDP-N-acetylmuramate dehydrogenase
VLRCRGRLLKDEALAKHTSWKVGGCADQLYIPADVADIGLFLAGLPADEQVILLGAGTNVLVGDEGVRGTVILISGCCNQFELIDENIVQVEMGLLSAQLARKTANLGLSGLEFLAGIPGTVGGALAMNAGAYGDEIWHYVIAVEMINRRGERFIRKPNEFEIGYRKVKKPDDEWFVAAKFKLEHGDVNKSLQSIHQLLVKRHATQPIGLPNAGSVFKNPPGDYAARLIEDSGLKGYRIGGAKVSEKHANFIVNDQNAVAGDIIKLIEHIKNAVKKKNNVTLQCEVIILV